MNILKNLFRKKSNKEDSSSENHIVVELNDKMMPIERGDTYEDPIDDFLQSKGIGEVTGGGTLQLQSGEIDYCDIQILLYSKEIQEEQINLIIGKFEELGAPKGSKLVDKKLNKYIEFGKKEGLAIYLDGVSLDKEVYENCDSNYVISEIKKLTNDNSEAIRYWENNNETALYFYSNSYEEMKESIEEFRNNYPLCQNSKVERIA